MKILFLGRLDDFKDPLTFIATAKLCNEHTFLLCGDGPLMAECKKRAEHIENLQVLGWVDRKIMGECDVFCQLSPVENLWAASMIESMYQKVPIIATNVGYTDKYMKGRAILIQPESPKALAKAIKQYEDPELRKKMASEAYKFAKKELSLKNIAKEFTEVLKC
jgi:glycosyltransferase involved in cell wall biosynthesis